MGQDLRSYLDLIKRDKPDELVIVSKEVDPAYEITALVVKLERERRRRPVIIFERVRGSRFPSSRTCTRAARAWPWRWARRRRRCSAPTCARWTGRSRPAWWRRAR